MNIKDVQEHIIQNSMIDPVVEAIDGMVAQLKEETGAMGATINEAVKLELKNVMKDILEE